MKVEYIAMVLLLLSFGCNEPKITIEESKIVKNDIEIVVLGTVQDGGAPHIGCTKSCCATLWKSPDETLKVVSLGLIDRLNDKVFIFEATPDFPEQMRVLNKLAERDVDRMPDGIFITHAHIGHYTGLMYLGREAKGAQNVPVYVMPRMAEFLIHNGPWSQLVELNNISIDTIGEKGERLTNTLTVRPFKVPHRDEYSETVGFTIEGANKKVLFIPDIDKWSKWETDIITKIKEVDLAFLDATFYDAEEINNRDISEIPHPFVIESMDLFGELSDSEKEKVHFIHLNHTNPLLDMQSKAYRQVQENRFNVARFLNVFSI